MPRKTFVFRSEPQGAVFRDLLRFASRHCRSFSLEWIEGGPLKLRRNHLAEQLHGFLIEERLTFTWRDFQHIEFLYRLNDDSVDVLARGLASICGTSRLGRET